MPPTRNVAEYVRPSELDIGAVAAALPAPLHAGAEQSANGTRAFYDTFDARLRAAGLRLLQEDGALKLVARDGAELAAARFAATPDALEPAELDGSLRERLAPVCDIRVLLRLAELDSARRVLPVLDDEEKTVARVVAEEAVARDGVPLRPRLHVIGVRGYDQEFERVRKALEKKLGLTPAQESFDEELQGLNAGPAVEIEKLAPDLPADRAAVALCTRLLHTIEANLPGTLADLDTEFLHDLRVAVRRTRALLRELKTVFPPDELAHFREEFKWVQQVTGPSRDLDVYLLDWNEFAALVPETQQEDLAGLRQLLEERRAAERVTMERDLRSARTTRLFSDWAVFLERLPGRDVGDRPDAVTPIGELAARRIARVYRQMVKMGRAISDASPHEDLHELRKKGKELRYLLEFFAPLFSAKVTKPMVRSLKALQDTLGRFQDREVQAAMIRDLADAVAGDRKSAQTLMAMGVLIERLSEQQDDARAEFAERFAAFSSPEQRQRVKQTFG
jgi:CHAD domain-containing protein